LNAGNKCIAAGTFTTSRDPELIAMQLNCLADGTVFPAVARNPAFDADAFLEATIADLALLLNFTQPCASRDRRVTTPAGTTATSSPFMFHQTGRGSRFYTSSPKLMTRSG
jgi:hypothetical protein